MMIVKGNIESDSESDSNRKIEKVIVIGVFLISAPSPPQFRVSPPIEIFIFLFYIYFFIFVVVFYN